MPNIIDGKAISAAIRGEIAEKVKQLKAEKGIVPGLAVIIVGEDPASKVYVRNKHRACEEVGFASFGYELPAETTEAMAAFYGAEITDASGNDHSYSFYSTEYPELRATIVNATAAFFTANLK